MRGDLGLRRPASLRGRVTLAVLALLVVILVLLFTAVDLALSARLHADARTRLSDRVALARQLDGRLSTQDLVNRLRGDGVTAQLCRRDGSSCVAAAPDPAPPGQPVAPRPTGRAETPGPAGPPAGKPKGKPARVPPVETAGSVLFVRSALDDGQVLTLSLDTTQITEAMNRLVWLEAAGGVLALALAGLAASRLSRTALRPLEDVTSLARQIAAGDRGRRLGTAGNDSELGRTAAAFDAMLDALEAALSRANAAEARMRAFLADASHELRTPMAGLQANAELLLREDPDRDERELLAVAMVRETRRAARLVEDLLTMARLGQGVDLATELVDVLRLAEAEAARARTLAPALTIVVEGAGPSLVDGDPLRLGQVVTNLLDNARHATPPGGTVTLAVRASGGRVLLDVTDTGPGVATAEQAIIFERFGRGDASRSRNTGGAGLGLPIARALARAHGGDLTYLDAPLGAHFRVDLPAAAPAPSSAITDDPASCGGPP